MVTPELKGKWFIVNHPDGSLFGLVHGPIEDGYYLISYYSALGTLSPSWYGTVVVHIRDLTDAQRWSFYESAEQMLEAYEYGGLKFEDERSEAVTRSRTCADPTCGKIFQPTRTDQQFCSKACGARVRGRRRQAKTK